MRIQACDEAFVRARRRDVYPYLADVGGYGTWWPGVSSRAVGDGGVLLLDRPRAWAAPQRLRLRITEHRPDLGVAFDVTGTFHGDGEWYLLDEAAGVHVHYVLRAEAGTGAWRRRVTDHRARVRAGLQALKDLLESGRAVGAEPDRRLLADQEHAIAEFEAAVERHAARRR